MYKATIGLEVHTELNTNSKMFSGSKNEYTKSPNINISPIDLAFPGILPKPNIEGVRKAIKLSMALNCELPDEVLFDRKNYYYADLPKGYQLTQMTKPFGKNGYIKISNKTIGIHQLHLEEDSASMTHLDNVSLLDYNRAGIPLIEIVSEPDMNTIDEVIEYLENLRDIIKYTNVSEASSEKGQLRVDVNISMSDSEVLGTRAEIKNINSFNTVKEVIAYEMKRQEEILSNGGIIEQETRRWDDALKKTIGMRNKVDAIDYKYFVEPNIPAVKLSEEFLEEIRKTIPKLPSERRDEYLKIGLTEKDAKTITREKEISDYFDKVLTYNVNPKDAANFITGKLMAYLNANNKNINETYMSPDKLSSLVNALSEEKISSLQAKEVFEISISEEKDPLDVISEKGMEVISDEGSIREMVKEVIKSNPIQYESYKNGKTALSGFFVGQTLKLSQGKANPTLVNKIVIEELNK